MPQAANILKIRTTARTLIMSDEGTHGGPDSVNVVVEHIDEYDHYAPHSEELSTRIQYVTTRSHGGSVISREVTRQRPSSLKTDGRIRLIKVALPKVHEELTEGGWRRTAGR